MNPPSSTPEPSTDLREEPREARSGWTAQTRAELLTSEEARWTDFPGNIAHRSHVRARVIKRTSVKLGLTLAGALLLLVTAIEAGWFVRFMATRSDWEPEPMPSLEMRCAQETAPVFWRYCVHRSPGSTSRDLLVHFHGRRGTERWWNDATYYPAELYAHWKTAGEQPPTVVSISFGPLWLLVGDTGEAFESVFERARAHAADWAGHDFDRHLLVGESMGGYNALLAGLDGKDRFDRVAALCPPLSAESPFGWGTLTRMGESSSREAFMLLAFSRAFFEDDEHWRRTDPIPRILAGEDFEPRLHLSCGERDPWGCAVGGDALVRGLRTQGDAPDWTLLPAGHCAIDTQRVAAFLTEPSGSVDSR